MRTKNIVHFQLKAFQGSEYDLWFPCRRGEPTGPSEVRPNLAEFKEYWPGHAIDLSKILAICAGKARELNFTCQGLQLSADMDSPGFGRLVDWLTELSARRLLYPESGLLFMELIDTPETPYPWFQFKPSRTITHINDRTGNVRNELTGNARRARPGMHIGDALLGPYVSETVKKAIESNGFTGAEFVWVEDKGLYHAPQWFWLTPQKCIGRGLDHPVFDIQKRTSYPVGNSPEWRFGVSWFNREELRSAAPFASPIWNQFVSLFAGKENLGLQFRTYRQYLRDYLPDTDFAYGREHGRAFLCFNRRVRDTLLSNGLVDESECHPILILDSAPMGVEIPDALGVSAHSYSRSLNREELATIQSENTAAYEEFLRNPKKPAPTDLEQSLQLLKEVQNTNARFFSPGAQEHTLEQAAGGLSVSIPQYWREVLRVSNGFLVEGFAIVAAENLPADQTPYGLPQVDGASTRYLRITDGDCGDFHCLDLSTLTPSSDCQVHEFDHEGPDEPVRVWATIAEFLEETLLTPNPDDTDQ